MTDLYATLHDLYSLDPTLKTVIAECERNLEPQLDFECDVCRKVFYVPLDTYRGEWDHPPNVATCPDCRRSER